MSLRRFYPLRHRGAAVANSGSNWSFEQGLTGWTPDSDSWIVAFPGYTSITPFHGVAHCCFDRYIANAASGTLTNADRFAVGVGGSKTATCRIAPQPNLGVVGGRVGIAWYDAGNALVTIDWSAYITTPTGSWQVATVTATRPGGATQCGLAIGATNADSRFKTGRVAFDWLTLA